MSFIKKYWIMEIALGLIAIGGVGIGVYNFAAASEAAESQNNGIAVIADANNGQDGATSPVLFQDMSDEDDDEFADADDDIDNEDDEMAGDEGGEDGDEVDDSDGEEMSADEEGEDGEGEEGGEGEFESDPLETAAKLIGQDIEEIEAEMANGRSLAEIASDAGLDREQFVADLVAQELAVFDAAVQAGNVSGEEAEEWREEIINWTPFWAQTPYLEPVVIAAQALNMDVDQVWDAVDNGQTIQDLAIAKNADLQQIEQAIVESETRYIEAMATAGIIESDELEEVRQEIDQLAQKIVTLPESQWYEEYDEGEEEEA